MPIGEHCWTSTPRSSETAVSGADAILAGEQAVYALCRPSGHHARADRATGFCYINNTAVAAQRLRSKFDKVAILDVDAHHGDGTQQIFYRRPDVLTISVHADPSNYYPFFTGYEDERGNGPGEGFNLNLPLVHGAAGAEMEAAVDRSRPRHPRIRRARRWSSRSATMRIRTTRSACSSWRPRISARSARR